MKYNPDKWVILKLTNKITNEVHYRVFATWYGGYTQGEEWKLNSGIEKVIVADYHYIFVGTSGSEYICNKETYGTSAWTQSVLNKLVNNAQQTTIEVLDDCEDWSCLNESCN